MYIRTSPLNGNIRSLQHHLQYHNIFPANTKMHFLSTLSAIAAALSLAVGADAWAQAADGRWVANNKIHTFGNGRK